LQPNVGDLLNKDKDKDKDKGIRRLEFVTKTFEVVI